ncbi:hypothetical protein T484DRAFT_1826363 [Baffinella frigidus]|nr:hypothetical protein T484DRAFT_1826363 [Cryptophyta sp. CCMP2293]
MTPGINYPGGGPAGRGRHAADLLEEDAMCARLALERSITPGFDARPLPDAIEEARRLAGAEACEMRVVFFTDSPLSSAHPEHHSYDVSHPGMDTVAEAEACDFRVVSVSDSLAEAEACDLRVVFVSDTEMGLRMVWAGDGTDENPDFEKEEGLPGN